jgi:YgiT-type zinc finger domain-containing protein
MDVKECPLCGTRMRLHTRERTDRVPGSRESKVSRVSEWVCPECDYFEDAEAS